LGVQVLARDDPDFELTESVIRQWAYDSTKILMDQDEELLLHDAEFVPLLVSLAADAACPRRAAILVILDGFFGCTLRNIVTINLTADARERASIDFAAFESVLGETEESDCLEMREWLTELEHRVACATRVVAMNEGDARQLANTILFAGRVGPEVRLSRRLEKHWEFCWPMRGSAEYLCINRDTGRYQIKKYRLFTDEELVTI